MVLQPK